MKKRKIGTQVRDDYVPLEIIPTVRTSSYGQNMALYRGNILVIHIQSHREAIVVERLGIKCNPRYTPHNINNIFILNLRFKVIVIWCVTGTVLEIHD